MGAKQADLSSSTDELVNIDPFDNLVLDGEGIGAGIAHVPGETRVDIVQDHNPQPHAVTPLVFTCVDVWIPRSLCWYIVSKHLNEPFPCCILPPETMRTGLSAFRARGKRLVKVVDDILRVFQAHREADQAVVDAGFVAFLAGSYVRG